jgi:hypothetical protein
MTPTVPGTGGPANQVHDFHPPIAPSGLYWVVAVPTGGLHFSPDGKAITLEMKDVPVVDQPRWPALDANRDAIRTPVLVEFCLVR